MNKTISTLPEQQCNVSDITVQQNTEQCIAAQESEMTCLLNYMPHEQHELQWLAAEAELEHRQAQHFHNTIFSSRTGSLKSCKLADQLQDSLWALSVVYSRALTDQVSCRRLLCHPELSCAQYCSSGKST